MHRLIVIIVFLKKLQQQVELLKVKIKKQLQLFLKIVKFFNEIFGIKLLMILIIFCLT